MFYHTWIDHTQYATILYIKDLVRGSKVAMDEGWGQALNNSLVYIVYIAITWTIKQLSETVK